MHFTNNVTPFKRLTLEQDEINKVKAECQYFLHWHYPCTPHDYFTEMAQQIPQKISQDVYGQGEYLQNFENELSDLLGHENCLFLPSGTMAQLIAMRIWSDHHDNSLIAFHPKCHMELHEQQAYKELHRLTAQLVGHPQHVITLDDLKNMAARPSCVLLELPQREIGGQLPSWDELLKQINYLHSMNIKVHLDGARLWECLSYYQKSYQEIARQFDSVYVSFYKGIGAISGAALLGSQEFIAQARIWLRRHGGNLFTLFPLYMSAKYNLDKRLNRFDSYYKKTLEIVEHLKDLEKIIINPVQPQVNMFHLYIKGEQETLTQKALQASKETGVWGFANIRATDSKNLCKIEWYVGDAVMDTPLEKITEYFQKLCM